MFTNSISRHFKDLSMQENTEIMKEYGNNGIFGAQMK